MARRPARHFHLANELWQTSSELANVANELWHGKRALSSLTWQSSELTNAELAEAANEL